MKEFERKRRLDEISAFPLKAGGAQEAVDALWRLRGRGFPGTGAAWEIAEGAIEWAHSHGGAGWGDVAKRAALEAGVWFGDDADALDWLKESGESDWSDPMADGERTPLGVARWFLENEVWAILGRLAGTI